MDKLHYALMQKLAEQYEHEHIHVASIGIETFLGISTGDKTVRQSAIEVVLGQSHWAKELHNDPLFDKYFRIQAVPSGQHIDVYILKKRGGWKEPDETD